MNKKEKRILVIGSKGFIGKNLTKYLLKLGYVVHGCDIVKDYISDKYYIIDEVNTDYNEIFSENNYDFCVNCSGAAEVSKSITSPYRDFSLNTINVFKLLDAIRIHQPLCKFINLSSAAVYGNPLYLPIDEQHPLNPLSPYGFHKLTSEFISKEYSELFGLKTCNIRIFSAYGIGLKKQLFWDLYYKSLNGENIALFGSGNESRDFIHIDDLTQAIELIILKYDFNNSSINVANGKEILIKDACQIFYTNFNKDIKFHFSGDTKIGDPTCWCANISILKSLGYEQKVSFEEGIKQYAKWIKELE